MKCERARELFSDYLAGGMDYALTATVRGHIEECPDCTHELDAFKRTWAALGTLPELDPPYQLRHDIVMQIARTEHAKAMHAKQGTFGLTWSCVLARLVPARAVAIACAGVALALILLKVPSMIEVIGKPGTGEPTTIAARAPSGYDNPAGVEASLLTAHENAMRQQWRGRKLQSNTLWVTATPLDISQDQVLYQVMLSINTEALVREATARIAAEVYLIPDSVDGGVLMDENGPRDASLVWRGDVVFGQDCGLSWPVYLSATRSGADKLLVTWTFRKRRFGQIIYVPTRKPSERASGILGLQAASFRSGGRGLYSMLDRISQDYGVTIVANAQLDQSPPAQVSSTQTLEEALRKTLFPVGLTWRWFDNAVHVDRDLGKLLAD